MNVPRPPRRLLDQVRRVVRHWHYPNRIKETHIDWIWRFILLHRKRQPKDMGTDEIEAPLTMRQFGVTSRRRRRPGASPAVLLRYQRVLDIELSRMDRIRRARKPSHLPTALTTGKDARFVSHLDGGYALVGANGATDTVTQMDTAAPEHRTHPFGVVKAALAGPRGPK